MGFVKLTTSHSRDVEWSVLDEGVNTSDGNTKVMSYPIELFSFYLDSIRLMKNVSCWADRPNETQP
ncbi:hypothetical protein RR46_04751 [Papilio xuthus]|uniref:Uncharacterized protein n=1 Tax=Papilio xuthus TaxID=66420 RepID=A0A194Q2I7_PAPXU|nr:hypothetical protein RR46_04751 [Papilio xuthus]